MYHYHITHMNYDWILWKWIRLHEIYYNLIIIEGEHIGEIAQRSERLQGAEQEMGTIASNQDRTSVDAESKPIIEQVPGGTIL